MMTVAELIAKWRKVELKERSAAHGWPADLPDDAILERLLALNAERTKA